MHLLSEPVDLPPGVAKDNGLSDGNGLVEIAERVKLPLFLLDSNIELLDTFKGQLIALDMTRILTGSRINFLVTSRTSAGMVAERRTTWVSWGRSWKTGIGSDPTSLVEHQKSQPS